MSKGRNNMADIIIADQEFNSIQKKIDGYFININSNISSYINVLKKITEQGISADMEIANKLALAADEISKITPLIETLQDALKESINAFVEDIDEADEFIY